MGRKKKEAKTVTGKILYHSEKGQKFFQSVIMPTGWQL